MPNRIIREGILGSERISRLRPQEEVLFRRLMSIVDDYGRHEFNPQFIRSRCYPLQVDQVTTADIVSWTEACQMAGLIQVYHSDGKCYLVLLNFQQQQRSASKCPEPPAFDITCIAPASKCLQMSTDAHLGVSVFVSGVVAHPPASAGAPPKPQKPKAETAQQPEDVTDEVWRDWCALRKAKKTTVSHTAIKEARVEAGKAGMTLDRFLAVWCARGSQGLQADWLKPDERRLSVVGVTVPGQQGKDPALQKIEDDALKAAPMPEEIRQRIAGLLGKRS